MSDQSGGGSGLARMESEVPPEVRMEQEINAHGRNMQASNAYQKVRWWQPRADGLVRSGRNALLFTLPLPRRCPAARSSSSKRRGNCASECGGAVAARAVRCPVPSRQRGTGLPQHHGLGECSAPPCMPAAVQVHPGQLLAHQGGGEGAGGPAAAAAGAAPPLLAPDPCAGRAPVGALLSAAAFAHGQRRRPRCGAWPACGRPERRRRAGARARR